MMQSDIHNDRRLETLWFNWRIIKYRPWAFAIFAFFTLLFLSGRVLPGLIEKRIFDTITGAEPVTINMWFLIALYISVELVRFMTSFGMVWADVTFRYTIGALLRRNMFASLLRRPGAKMMLISSGEAINRYGDDVDEVADFPTWFPHVAGN